MKKNVTNAAAVANSTAAAQAQQPKTAAEAQKIAQALNRRVVTLERNFAKVVEKLETAKKTKAAAKELIMQIGCNWKQAQENKNYSEMCALKRKNDTAKKAENKALLNLNIWKKRKETAAAELKEAKAAAAAAERTANKLLKEDKAAQQKKAAEEAANSAKLRNNTAAAEAAAEAAAKTAEEKRKTAKAAAEAAAEAEAAERRRRVDLAHARSSKGTATAEDTAIIAEETANKNAANVWNAAAVALLNLRKNESFKAAWKTLHIENTSLSHACKDVVKMWKIVAPVLNAAAVGITAAEISPKLFAVENVSPFLCVATKSGVKIGMLNRTHIVAVNNWNSEKVVLLLIMNAIILNICKKDTAAAAAETQKAQRNAAHSHSRRSETPKQHRHSKHSATQPPPLYTRSSVNV